MSLIYLETSVEDVTYNDTRLTKIKLDDTTIWEQPLFYNLLDDGSGYSVTLGDPTVTGAIAIADTFNGKTVVAIESCAFKDATGITSIDMPHSITSIGWGAFSGCSNLNIALISDGVTSIEDQLFSNCTNLTYVKIPDGVTTIGEWAFWECENLTNITIPDGVTTIDWAAFYGCESLTSIAIPNSVTSIGSQAFCGCNGLTGISIPDSITAISDYTFSYCHNLSSIIISDSVTSIGGKAFNECESLTSVYYKGTASDWKNVTIGASNESLTNATVYYYSEEHPTENGNFWHYEDGFVTVWCSDIIIDEAIGTTCGAPGYTEGKHCGVCGTVLVEQEVIEALPHTEVIDHAVLATCTESGKTQGSHCSVCGKILAPQAISYPLGHSWNDATCTEPKTCSRCGVTEGDALGHTWSDWNITLEPTCTEDGSQYRTCTVCDHTATGTIAKLNHNYVGTIVRPTCTEQGYMYHECTRCKDSYKDEFTDAVGHTWIDATCTEPKTCSVCGATEGSALGHKWKDATCTEPKTCSVCGVTEGEALGHTEVIDLAVPATCTESGLTEGSHCSVCGEILKPQATSYPLGHSWVDATCTEPKTCSRCGLTDGNALGHSYGDWTVTLEPDCTTTGTQKRTCAVCGHVHTGTVAALGHNYIGTIVRPTCTEQGYMSYECTRCKDTYKDSYTDALGHTWVDATCTEPKTCSVCKITEGEALGHSYGEWSTTIAATCTTEGKEVRTCVRCKNQETQTIPALGHFYESVVTEPTCEAQGYTTHTCIRDNCNYAYKDNYTDATGHSWNDPTYSWDGYSSCTATRVCKNDSSHTETATAIVTSDITTPATCIDPGTKTYTATFSETWAVTKTKTETIAAKGHTYSMTKVGATCTEQGYDLHTCSCGHSYKDNYTDALGHEYGEWTITLEPTCTETGTQRRDCSRCDAYETGTVAAKGHDWSAWTIVSKPTCTEAGQNRRTCSVCDAFEVELVEAGHTWKAATCTTPKTCSVCGATEGTASHTEVDYPYVAPTATSVGYTGGSYCSACGTVLEEREKILMTPAITEAIWSEQGRSFDIYVKNNNGVPVTCYVIIYDNTSADVGSATQTIPANTANYVTIEYSSSAVSPFECCMYFAADGYEDSLEASTVIG